LGEGWSTSSFFARDVTCNQVRLGWHIKPARYFSSWPMCGEVLLLGLVREVENQTNERLRELEEEQMLADEARRNGDTKAFRDSLLGQAPEQVVPKFRYEPLGPSLKSLTGGGVPNQLQPLYRSERHPEAQAARERGEHMSPDDFERLRAKETQELKVSLCFPPPGA